MRKFIYRYKYLPDMLGIEGVVANGTIKFTHPAKFNDPFDCMPRDSPIKSAQVRRPVVT